jgi:hypothetical protein
MVSRRRGASNASICHPAGSGIEQDGIHALRMLEPSSTPLTTRPAPARVSGRTLDASRRPLDTRTIGPGGRMMTADSCCCAKRRSVALIACVALLFMCACTTTTGGTRAAHQDCHLQRRTARGVLGHRRGHLAARRLCRPRSNRARARGDSSGTRLQTVGGRCVRFATSRWAIGSVACSGL